MFACPGSSVDVYFVGGYCWWAEPQAAEAALDGSGYGHCIVALSCSLYHIYASCLQRGRTESFADLSVSLVNDLQGAFATDARLLLFSLPPSLGSWSRFEARRAREDHCSQARGMLGLLARTPSTLIARRPAALRRLVSSSIPAPQHSIYISNSTDPYFNLSFEDWCVCKLKGRQSDFDADCPQVIPAQVSRGAIAAAIPR